MANFDFSFTDIWIHECRSPNTDTNYASVAVRVGNTVHGPSSKYIGDLGRGRHDVGVSVIADVPNDGIKVIVSWNVINDNGNSDAALNLVGNLGLGVVGTALSGIPVVGTALAAVFSIVVNPFRNHNGPCVVQQFVTTGTALNALAVNGATGVFDAKNYGRDLPGGDTSDYSSNLRITRLI
jgi:hypothetical protein